MIKQYKNKKAFRFTLDGSCIRPWLRTFDLPINSNTNPPYLISPLGELELHLLRDVEHGHDLLHEGIPEDVGAGLAGADAGEAAARAVQLGLGQDHRARVRADGLPANDDVERRRRRVARHAPDHAILARAGGCVRRVDGGRDVRREQVDRRPRVHEHARRGRHRLVSRGVGPAQRVDLDVVVEVVRLPAVRGELRSYLDVSSAEEKYTTQSRSP